MRLLVRFQTFLIAALLVVPAGTAPAQDKLPIPNQQAKSQALKLVTELYRGEYKKAKSQEQKLALARTMLQEAIDTKDDPAGQYILLRFARDIASSGSDVRLAMQAIDAMDRRFQIDALKMKSDSLVKLGVSAETSDEHFAIAQTGKDLLDEAFAEDQFELAKAIGETALNAASKARNPTIRSEILARNKAVKEFETAYHDAKSAMAILENKPADPEANLTVGKYQSFYKGQWNKGLTMLVLGSDTALKAVAKKELQVSTKQVSASEQPVRSLGPTTAVDQMELADDWWTTSGKEAGSEKEAGEPKKQMQLRAAYWYQKALPNLSGLAKMKASKRLEEIEKSYGQAVAQITGTQTARSSRQQLLETLGTLAAAQLYQTYFSLTLVANGQRQGNFSAEEAKQMLTLTESLIQSVDQQLEKAGNLNLDKEDRDSIAQLRKLGKMLHSQSKLLQLSWNTENKAAADRSYQRYLQSHNESWRAIKKLLGL